MTAAEYAAAPHPCVDCGKPTDFGSGRFVDRIPADTYLDLGDGTLEYRNGYMCAMCANPAGYEREAGIYLCTPCGDQIIEQAASPEADHYDALSDVGLTEVWADDMKPGTRCSACEVVLL